MSGGFFRGTSADQDTRFSNKQAKLMKSQKFAPELEHLVDMTKVEMDVMRPWIAKRVTELLGFEDEVLINFIYGLLEGKVVNGKEIQISITGFMEKNTGKFMKELWTLLLSAQNNASRVPQQFLDAKEEETRSKKVEADRIKNEMMRVKEKEGREREEEKRDKMDGKVDDTALPSLRHQPRDSNTRLATDDKQMNGRNGSRGRTSDSPSRSNSKSLSNSRSHSDERHRSRSISGSSQKRGRSISSEQIRHSPLRRSTSPRRRDSPQQSFSPRSRTSYFRQRSMSPRSRRRPPSPTGRRLHSPIRRRSRSPVCHRSRTPERRRLRTPIRRRSRSPLLRRSRTPQRRRSRTPQRRRSRTPQRRRSRTPQRRRSRSPLCYMSPSPIRCRSRSPMSRRSPSPMRRRSPSPLRRRYRRSPSSPRRRSPSPYRRRPTLPSRRRSSTPRRRSSTPRRRSSSPLELGSQSPRRQLSPSPVRRRSPKRHRSPAQSPRDNIRSPKQYFPDRQPPRHENIEHGIETHKSTLERRLLISNVRSPQRGSGGQHTTRRKVPSLSPSPNNSPLGSESPPTSTKRSPTENRSPYGSPRRQTREPMIHPRRPSPPHKSVVQKPNLDTDSQQEKKIKLSREGEDSKHKSSGKKMMQPSSDGLKLNQQKKSETKPQKVPQSEVLKQLCPSISKNMLPDVRVKDSHSGEGYRTDDKSRYHADHIKGSSQLDYETFSKVTPKINKRKCGDSESEISDKPRAEVSDKRKHKRSKRTESDDDSCDSILKERKETKRRKKEEKRLKKEEKRRRREERRRRKEERRAEKIKLKSVGTVSPPSDTKDNHDGYASDGGIDEAESEQKKLEIELRERALESLRSKKGTGH